MRLIVLFILLYGQSAFAQSNIKIVGIVKSTEGLHIRGVTVGVDTNQNVNQCVTDSLGFFSFNLKVGLFRFSVSHYGFKDKVLIVNVRKDTILPIVLEKDFLSLKEVKIFNNKKTFISALSGGKLSFNLKELSALPSILGTTDIIKLLQLTPGIQNSGDANGYLYVRGGDPGHNSILYNGTPIYGMSHLLGVFPFYNTDHIQEVEFDKSSTNAKYGGRLSATTMLIPNMKIPTQFSVQGNVGVLASQVTLAVPVGNKSGLFVSGRKSYIDDIVAPIVNSFSKNSDLQDIKYGFFDSNLTFVSEISKNNTLLVDAFYSADKLKIVDSNIALETNLKWGNFSFSPKLISNLSPKITMSNAFYFTQYLNNLDMQQATIQLGVSSFVKDFGFANSVRFSIDAIPFESGLQYAFHNLQPQKIKIESQIASTIDEQHNLIKSTEFAVFCTAKPKFSKFFNAELGLRINYYNAGSQFNSYLHLQPRIVLNFDPNKNLTLYASYNRQNQYLSLITTSSVGMPTDFWIASSDGIAPQTSDEFSIGSNQNLTKNITASFAGFFRSMRNLLEYPYGVVQFNEISTLKNDLLVGKGTSYGIETMLRKKNGKLNGWLSYTLSWSSRNFDGINNANTYFAKYDRRHNLAFVGTYDLNPKWSFGITQIFSSGNRFTLPTSWYFINNNPVKEYSEFNNAQMPNYLRTDLSVNYFFIKSTKKESALIFSLFNSLNIENPIYTVLNVQVNEDQQNAVVETEEKIIYRIIPSISWRFKF